MKWLRLLSSVLVLALGAGCGAKKKTKEITDSQRREAALHLSEAQFALSVRDWARAEPLLAKAADLAPDEPGLWLDLGMTRMRLKQRDTAKTAYQEALAAFREAAKKEPANPQWVVQQVTTLVVLGRPDEARALVDKLPGLFPDNVEIKRFVAAKPVDKMLADPKLKELTL